MDFGSFLIGAGGLFVAGLSLWLDYKGKTSLYRERLYEKQLQVYPQVIQAHVLLNDAMRRVTTYSLVFSERHAESDRKSLLDSVREANHQWLASQKILERIPGWFTGTTLIFRRNSRRLRHGETVNQLGICCRVQLASFDQRIRGED